MTIARSQTIFIDASPQHCFDLCADVASWPLYMPAVRRGYRVKGSDADEVIELEAESGDQFITWRSRRQMDVHHATIVFERLKPAAPFISMTGIWRFLPAGEGCEVRLEHVYALTADGNPIAVEAIISSNVTRDLEGMKAYLEEQPR